MATDFTNNNKTISASGGLQPTTINTPLDVRTRVNLKADIDSIPNPFVGMKILVLQDETNGNQMTEYVVVSLKADSLGIENAKVNEVVLMKDFLGVSGSTSGSGMTSEQVQKLNTAYTHSQSTHVQQSDIPTKTSQLTNDSGYLTEHQDISGKANKSEIPTKTSQLTNDSGYITNEVNELNILSLVLGNYQIKYNSVSDTLDFLYNGVEEPETNNYVREGLSLYIDAQDVATQGSIKDITGKQNIVNHGVSTTLDNNCLNFVASESDYIDGGFKPNLTRWSAEFYFYFTTPGALLSWGARGNRTSITVWDNDFVIAINNNTTYTIMSTIPTSLTHLVVTYNNGTIIAYANGVKSQLTTSANVMSSQAGNLMVCTKYDASDEFSSTHLKSLRFYDGKVLTDEEVLQNYNYEINRG